MRNVTIALALVGTLLASVAAPASAAELRGSSSAPVINLNPVVIYSCDGSVRVAPGTIVICDGSVRPIR
jgi:hypothetical protein